MSEQPPPTPSLDPDAAFDEMLMSPAEREKWRRQQGQFTTSRKRAKPVAPYDLQRMLNKHKPGYKLKELPALRARVTDADWKAVSPRDESVAAFVARVAHTGSQWKQVGRAYALEVETAAIRRLIVEEGGGFRTRLDALLLPLSSARRSLVAPTPLQALVGETQTISSPLAHLNSITTALLDELDLMLGALYLFPLPASNGLLAVLTMMFNVLPLGALQHTQAPAVAIALTVTSDRPPSSITPPSLCVVPWPAPSDDHVQGMPQVPTSWTTHLQSLAPARATYCGCALVEPCWLLPETVPATHYARVDKKGGLHSGEL